MSLFLQMAGTFTAVLFCLLCGIFSWCHLRDGQRARKYARSRPSGPPAVVVHLSLGERLSDLEQSKQMIREARRKLRPDEYDIETIMRQIEGQN